jgi:hypothetical protein
VPVGQQHAGEQCPGAGGGAQRDRAAVQLGERPGRHQDHRLHRAVAADGEVGQEQQVVGMTQVLEERNGPDVQIARDECGVEPVGRVLVQVDVQQGTRAHQSPVDRQAVEELDVAHPGSPGGHRGHSFIAHPSILPRPG